MDLYKIEFDLEKGEWKNEFVQVDNTDSLEEYYKYIDCRLVDIVQLTEEVVAIVDDEGLLKSGNPVFEFTLNKHKFNLVGNILLGKTEVDDFEKEIVSLDELSFTRLSEQLGIKLIGITN